jgi:hypothetical protein
VPEVRLLFVVRDPVDRIRSHYLHELAALRERRPLELALRENPIYLDRSRYAMQLERYLANFPRERLLVVRAENLFRAPLALLPRVYAFVGIDPSWRPPGPVRRANETARKFQLPTLVRRGVKVAGEVGVYRHVPRWTKETIRMVTQRRSRTMPEVRIPAELATELRVELADDLRRLNEIAGEPLFP